MIPVPKTLKASDTASHLAARMIGSVRVNRVSPGSDQGGDRLEKVRRFGAGPLIILGNEFLISRGLGDTLPLRFRCPHEVVVAKLGGRA